MSASEFESGLNRSLHATLWSPKPGIPHSQIEGVVVFVHGLGDHSARFQRLAERWCDRRWAVLGLDLPGHGLSRGKRGGSVSYERLLKHVAATRLQMKRRFPDAVQVLMGHSMGGNIAMNYAIRRGEFDDVETPPLDALVMCSPMLLPPNPLRRDQVLAAWLTGRMIPWFRFRNHTPLAKLTGDIVQMRAIRSDPLIHDRVSLGLATRLVTEGRFALDHADKLDLPCRIDIGSDDALVSQAACRHAAIRIGGNAEFRIWENQRHDLLHDSLADQVIDELCQWTNLVTQTRGPQSPGQCKAA